MILLASKTAQKAPVRIQAFVALIFAHSHI